MVTSAYPVPEGFTELEVFSIGTALLVEGAILRGLKQSIMQEKIVLYFMAIIVCVTTLLCETLESKQHLSYALLGFCLNVLTILSFCKIKELRTPGNFLVFNLALSDCGICANAFIAAFSSFLRYWPYGSDGCQIHGFQGFLTALTSISSAAAVAWDRYHHYCSRSKSQWSSVISMVVFVWVFAAFWSVMPLLGWGEYDYEPLRTCCTLDYTKGDRNYVTYLIPLALFNFVIPGFIILTAYQSIDHKFRKTGQIRFNTGLPVKSLVICWGPYSLLCFYAAVENVTFISPKIRMIPAVIAKTSPAVNALIYALGNENYRGGIWQFLTGQKIEKPETDNKTK